MAALTDDYLDYLNVRGALDEGRYADRRAPRRSTTIHADPDAWGGVHVAPGERLQIPGQGDVTEPLMSPGDLWGPIAAKLGKETADLLVPYLMRSVSRMAPLLTEAQRALRRGGRDAPAPRDFQAEAAETIGAKRAAAEAEDAAFLAQRQQEIDAAFQQRDAAHHTWLQERYPSIDWDAPPEGTTRRILDLETGMPSPSARPWRSEPSGDAKQYEDIIRKLFEAGGR